MRRNSLILPVVILFVMLNALLIVFRAKLEAKNIDQEVLIGANILLFLLTIVGLMMHQKAIKNPNPNVFIRSVLSATVLKLFVIGAAVFIYIAAAGPNKNENAILASMVMYFFYTFMEVRLALRLNSKKNE